MRCNRANDDEASRLAGSLDNVDWRDAPLGGHGDTVPIRLADWYRETRRYQQTGVHSHLVGYREVAGATRIELQFCGCAVFDCETREIRRSNRDHSPQADSQGTSPVLYGDELKSQLCGLSAEPKLRTS